ncbi:hypothetical protein DFP72DRAFT_1134103 [Ephemerocybe angulata]|uniref:Uncharacterized protein n=1 Tax=Ephemerocybe angulata TaxID=980116 RepID=A0A8H6HV24_9AGAR|nr:hypothetical protein DFP72DRAFT_1134103 [Tulosesus angulatus]
MAMGEPGACSPRGPGACASSSSIYVLGRPSLRTSSTKVQYECSKCSCCGRSPIVLWRAATWQWLYWVRSEMSIWTSWPHPQRHGYGWGVAGFRLARLVEAGFDKSFGMVLLASRKVLMRARVELESADGGRRVWKANERREQNAKLSDHRTIMITLFGAEQGVYNKDVGKASNAFGTAWRTLRKSTEDRRPLVWSPDGGLWGKEVWRGEYAPDLASRGGRASTVSSVLTHVGDSNIAAGESVMINPPQQARLKTGWTVVRRGGGASGSGSKVGLRLRRTADLEGLVMSELDVAEVGRWWSVEPPEANSMNGQRRASEAVQHDGSRVKASLRVGPRAAPALLPDPPCMGKETHRG